MRRAFVMGSNGPSDYDPLRFAQIDAERIKACLSGVRCGFEVVMPAPGTDAFEVRRQLLLSADACTSEDTFICYFSGHGILEKGTLVLLWDNTQVDRFLSTALPVSEILLALKHCKAQSKLLILDCCHAGAIVNMLGWKEAAELAVKEIDIHPDNYLVLMASDRLEKAREFEMLQGSFLTVNLCYALAEKFEEADHDGDGRISVPDLKRWLQERAKEHNRQFPESPVPYPYLFGQERGDFYLTQGASDWEPYEIAWPDGSIMVVLPIALWGGRAFCISKYPVTNEQYMRFVKMGGGKEPVGEHYRQVESSDNLSTLEEGYWQGPFYPWREEGFSAPEKPVVCVTYHNALDYCEWVNVKLLRKEDRYLTKLPTTVEWDLAAFGTQFPTRKPGVCLNFSRAIHHKALSPASIDLTAKRSNKWGISDLFGNIWEWCGEEYRRWFRRRHGVLAPPRPKLMPPPYKNSQLEVPLHDIDSEVRGGGFLDDLSQISPFIDVQRLRDKVNTSHSDLGFRIAAIVPFESLPEDIQLRLSYYLKPEFEYTSTSSLLNITIPLLQN